ncbi:tyrosine-type recombinase/integrase [Hymenobacter nivis]|uniref:Tyr recombinase domain-containing protein n=1 Tax=Hymenobacter nivis TaxID=1850093 RepID=A0A502G8P4_9BACT|nr:tyrosine-type recombinase/integrase [Hymenobacter nivis]TPG58002.1 hypothetical protein EAH73_22680 [Hymenobacter nivis]
MTKRLPFIESRKDSVRNWPFQPPQFDKSLVLSPSEKTTLSAWKAHGHLGWGSKAFKKEIKQQLNRLIQPVEVALLHWGIPKGGERLLACVSLLLHEMHQRQTSLWAWDETAWAEIVGKTYEDFRTIHHDFQRAHHIANLKYRQCVLACAYLLSEIPIYRLVTGHNTLVSAQRIFGGVAVEKALHTLTTESTRIGRAVTWAISQATCSALLANRSPILEKLTLPVIEKLHESDSHNKARKKSYVTLSIILYNIKVLSTHLPTPCYSWINTGIDDNLCNDWPHLIPAWFDHLTDGGASRNETRVSISSVAKAARWAAEKYPATAGAQQWTKSMARAYRADVQKMNVGQWQHPKTKSTPRRGEPLGASYQAQLLQDLRLFFNDCHELEWFPRAFDPDRHLATPRRISARRGPNPRPIDDAQWAKLVQAGLSITQEDLPSASPFVSKRSDVTPKSWYPLAMVRALALVWLYSGLRANEIRRLRVGCIRSIPGEENESRSASTHALCNLIVPVGKNGRGFLKPIIKLVGDAIELWEKIRPSVPKHRDDKTTEEVDFLFVWKGERIGQTYLNDVLISMLCRKAGIPLEDALGKITSHRARHTLATQLANAPTPLRGPYLSNWIGHRSRGSLGHYVQENEHKVQETYAAANRVSIDKRQLEQLKEFTAIGGESATEDGPTRSVDLGHGFCIYDFYDQCKQRKPCMNCSFYRPKESLYSQLREVRSQLLHMLNSIPLSKEARQAVEDAIAINERLEAILRSTESPPS